jgi:hypothetical protein
MDNPNEGWFALKEDGEIHYLGEFNSFEAADESLGEDNAVWLFCECTAREWKDQIEEGLALCPKKNS